MVVRCSNSRRYKRSRTVTLTSRLLELDSQEQHVSRKKCHQVVSTISCRTKLCFSVHSAPEIPGYDGTRRKSSLGVSEGGRAHAVVASSLGRQVGPFLPGGARQRPACVKRETLNTTEHPKSSLWRNSPACRCELPLSMTCAHFY